MSNETAVDSVHVLLGEVGRTVDPDEANDVHRARAGEFELVLRRDCHGVLRRLEVSFPSDARESVRNRLDREGWLTVSAGQLDIVDVTGLGKLYLLTDRLSVTFRMRASEQSVRDVILQCVGAQGTERSTPDVRS